MHVVGPDNLIHMPGKCAIYLARQIVAKAAGDKIAGRGNSGRTDFDPRGSAFPISKAIGPKGMAVSGQEHQIARSGLAAQIVKPFSRPGVAVPG